MNVSRIKARLQSLRAEIDDLEKELEAGAEEEGGDSPWMRIGDYAAYARVSSDTVRNWIAVGMPATGKGKLTRINRDEADAWRKSR